MSSRSFFSVPDLNIPETKNSRPHWLDAWHVSASVNRDYDFIDGLRGIAILMVLVGHAFYINPNAGPALKFISSFVGTGGHGVTLFFALSGFLISWPFWKSKMAGAQHCVPRGYGWRRFWKIYPPLMLSILLLTPLSIIIGGDWTCLTIAVQWLCGISFLIPVSGKLNPVMWSLVVEVQFYLVLPLIFLCLKRVSIKNSFWILSLIFFVVPVAVHLCTGSSPTFHPDINSGFPTGLASFYFGIMVAGMNCAGLMSAGKIWGRIGDFGLALFLVALSTLSWLWRHPAYSDFWALEGVDWVFKLASGCMLCYVADPKNPRARMLCMPWLRWCGIISYEWYLFHQPLLLDTRFLLGPASGNAVKYVAVVGFPFLISLIISALIYRFYSLPILQRGRSRSGPPNPISI